MNLFQALSFREPAPVRSFGKARSIPCEGRCCPDRSAPVFVVLGVRGVLALCAACRAWQNRIVRAAIHELRRDA